MNTNSRVYVAGHTGMVGSSIYRLLKQENFSNLIIATRNEVNLFDENKVNSFLTKERPQIMILSAARVGGIQANMNSPFDFLFENLVIQNNLIKGALDIGVEKIVFLGSSCIYPKEAKQPMSEDFLLTGPLEPTNEGYALAKITGLKLVEYMKKQYGIKGFSLLPCNLYGTNDHFDLEKSHVLSSLVRRFCDAVDEGKQEVTLWGTGQAKREFMHVDDMAKAVLYFLERDSEFDLLNIGVGEDISIKDLAMKIANETNFSGKINWDTSKPDGMLRKCMDVSKMKSLGFVPTINIDEGIKKTIIEYRALKIRCS